MKTLLPFFKGHYKVTILAPLFKMLEASFDLCVPLVMAAIIDIGILKGDMPYILQMSALLVLLGAVGLTCSITAQYYAAKSAVQCCVGLRKTLFSNIQSFSYSQMDKLGGNTLITRMTSDVNATQNAINLFLRLFLRSPFVILGSLILAFTLNFRAALVFTISIPVLAAIIMAIMYITMPLYKKVQGKLDVILTRTRENLTGVRVVRAFDKGKAEVEAFCADNSEFTILQQNVGRISNWTNPLTYCVVNLAIIAILYVGGGEVNDGRMLQGDVIALINYMGQILVELVKLANLIVQVSKGMASFNRVKNVLEMQPDMKYPPKKASASAIKTAPSVEFKNVSLSYNKEGQESIKDVSFVAKRGEVIGIIGGTGSGKTTLVNAIARFYDVTEGEVLLLGNPINMYGKLALRKFIGIVPQQAQLFGGTIRSNLLWGNENASDDDLWRALEYAQGAEFVRKKDDTLDAKVEQNGRNFSGGQRQRLTIARALVAKPEILILDDSASALDYATDAALRKSLAKFASESTIFIVSQRTASLSHADQILVLEEGALVGKGKHEDLLLSCEVYKEIYESQFAKGEVHHA